MDIYVSPWSKRERELDHLDSGGSFKTSVMVASCTSKIAYRKRIKLFLYSHNPTKSTHTSLGNSSVKTQSKREKILHTLLTPWITREDHSSHIHKSFSLLLLHSPISHRCNMQARILVRCSSMPIGISTMVWSVPLVTPLRSPLSNHVPLLSEFKQIIEAKKGW